MPVPPDAPPVFSGTVVRRWSQDASQRPYDGGDPASREAALHEQAVYDLVGEADQASYVDGPGRRIDSVDYADVFRQAAPRRRTAVTGTIKATGSCPNGSAKPRWPAGVPLIDPETQPFTRQQLVYDHKGRAE